MPRAERDNARALKWKQTVDASEFIFHSLHPVAARSSQLLATSLAHKIDSAVRVVQQADTSQYVTQYKSKWKVGIHRTLNLHCVPQSLFRIVTIVWIIQSKINRLGWFLVHRIRKILRDGLWSCPMGSTSAERRQGVNGAPSLERRLWSAS